MGMAVIASLIFFLYAKKLFYRSQEIALKNKEEVIPFNRNIVAGVIAGIIVIALDRVITKWVTNPPTPDFSSIQNFLFSIIGIVVVAVLVASFLLWITSYLIYRGLEGITEQKKERIESSNNIESPIKFTLKSMIKDVDLSYLKKLNPFSKSYFTQIILPLILFAVAIIIAQYHFSASIQNSIELSEESINETYWLTSPVVLDVKHSYDLDEGRLYINATNTHPIRNTGVVYLYKLEDNPFKPEMINEKGIGPGETINYSLTITSRYENITFTCNPNEYGGFDFSFPSSKVYYVFKDISISYKIGCDNCPPDGFIRRVPDFGSIESIFTLTSKCVEAVSIPVFGWLDYKLEDIKINK